MPNYRVEALEKFIVRTVYFVEAPSRKDAEALCRKGNAAYDEHQIEEGDEVWLKTVSVRKTAPAVRQRGGRRRINSPSRRPHARSDRSGPPTTAR